MHTTLWAQYQLWGLDPAGYHLGMWIFSCLGLFGLLFFLVGISLFGIGLLGEYLGHVVQQARGRRPYLVREELTPRPAARRSKG